MTHSAQTHDLKTSLAGSIARACTVFCVDEIVVFNDGTSSPLRSSTSFDAHREEQAARDAESGYTAYADPDHFLWHLLTYLETPPCLRRTLCGFHPNLKSAGALQSLDAPHHPRSDQWCVYREGVTIATASNGRDPGKAGLSRKDQGKLKNKRHEEKESSKGEAQTLVNAGLAHPVSIPASIPPNTRVTVEFPSEDPPNDIDLRTRKRNTDDDSAQRTPIAAKAVHPSTPRTKSGYYWGYTTRTAPSLSSILTTAPYTDTGGYDFVIGTSERGTPLSGLLEESRGGRIPEWKHLLIVFGGLAGLEAGVRNDEMLKERGVREPSEVFDAYIDVLEGGQGSRTVRTEEAVWVGLMGLKGFCAR